MTRKRLLKLHFILFLLAILNTVLKLSLQLSLANSFELMLELSVVLTGIFLFFTSLKPFKWAGIYFSIYPLSLIVTSIGFALGGILSAILVSIILHPIYPNDLAYEKDNIRIYVPFEGALARCCPYLLVESRGIFFEKNYGEIPSQGPLDFEEINIVHNKNEIALTFEKKRYDELIKEFVEFDTTIIYQK